MSEEEKTIHFKFNDYEQPGFYLTLEDSTKIELTRENIEKVTMEYWKDPGKIPPSVKDVVEFKRCSFCPLKKKEDLCDALRPILPLLDVMDNYHSFDKVIAVYRGDDKTLYHVSSTTMQRMLQYITTLSLIRYCQVGRKYWKYFSGIIPVMETHEIVNRIYLNMYWIHNGDTERVHQIISKLNSEITITTRNQMERLQLISKKDAFLNAFVLTHMITDILEMYKDTKLMEQLENFDKNVKHL